MATRVLIADDEPLARRRLERLLADERDVELVASCGDGVDALAALRARAVDVALLDVEMPELGGVDVVAAFGPERMPPTIFVTAYDAYAVRAFELHALDYVVKPVTAERFRVAFRRAREHLAREAAARSGERLRALLSETLEGGGQRVEGGAGVREDDLAIEGAAVSTLRPPPSTLLYVQRLFLRGPNGRTFLVRASDVDWFEADRNAVRAHVGREVYTLPDGIGAVERTLDPAQFARVHRGTIVNLDRVRELQPWFAGDQLLILRDGTRLKLSRTYRDRLSPRPRAE
jgi:two-component system LytT family response regulator